MFSIGVNQVDRVPQYISNPTFLICVTGWLCPRFYSIIACSPFWDGPVNRKLELNVCHHNFPHLGTLASGFITSFSMLRQFLLTPLCGPLHRNHVKPQSRGSDGAPSPVTPVPLVDGLTGLRSPQPPAGAGNGPALGTTELSPSFTHLTASEPSDDTGMANRGRSVGSLRVSFVHLQVTLGCSASSAYLAAVVQAYRGGNISKVLSCPEAVLTSGGLVTRNSSA